MIADSSKITMSDFVTKKEAIEIQPTNQIATLRIKYGRITGKNVAICRSALTLMLSTGLKLTGSYDQQVRKWDTRGYVELEDIEIGDKLLGFEGGVTTLVSVVGILNEHDKDVRLVSFHVEHLHPFIAEGIVCRAS